MHTPRVDRGIEWTGELVGTRLVEAFRRLPFTPIYSRARDVLLPLAGGRVEGLALIALTSRYLGRDSVARVKLLTWARGMSGGLPVREACRANSWPRSSFRRDVRAALDAIAVGLNRDRELWP